MWRSIVIALLGFSTAVPADEDLGFKPSQGKPKKLQAEELDEASGMVVSRKDPALMWLLNDSGGKPALYLAGVDGSDRGLCTIRGATNVDWEDLSSFTLGGKNYLLISDAGDNDSVRKSCILYIIEEPALPKAGAKLNSSAAIAWSIPFVYPDGPRDCEAVAADASAGKIYLISKRTKPPVVYELPLHPKTPGMLTAKRMGTTSTPQPKWSVLPYGSQPTGLALSPDGSLAAVLTYTGVHLFPRKKGESWPDALARPAAQVMSHTYRQTESIAFSPDGKTLWVTSEGVHAPIYSWVKGP